MLRDIYRVEAPQEALDELPPEVFAASEWSGIKSAAQDAAPNRPRE
jgi:hypothetical protein